MSSKILSLFSEIVANNADNNRSISPIIILYSPAFGGWQIELRNLKEKNEWIWRLDKSDPCFYFHWLFHIFVDFFRIILQWKVSAINFLWIEMSFFILAEKIWQWNTCVSLLIKLSLSRLELQILWAELAELAELPASSAQLNLRSAQLAQLNLKWNSEMQVSSAQFQPSSAQKMVSSA